MTAIPFLARKRAACSTTSGSTAIRAKFRQFFVSIPVEKTSQKSYARFRRIRVARFRRLPSRPGTISDITATVTMIFARCSPVGTCMDKTPKATDGESVPERRGELPSSERVSPYGPVEKSSLQAIWTCRFSTPDIGNSSLARHPGRAWTRATGECQQLQAVPRHPQRVANG